MMRGVQSQLKKQQILWSLLISLPSLGRWYKCYLISGGWYGIGRLYAWNSIIYCIVNHAASKIMSSPEVRNHLIPIFILRNECSGQSQRGKGLFPSTNGSYMNQRCEKFPNCLFDCCPNWLLMTPSFSRRCYERSWGQWHCFSRVHCSHILYWQLEGPGRLSGLHLFSDKPKSDSHSMHSHVTSNLTLMKWGGAELFLVGHAAQW